MRRGKMDVMESKETAEKDICQMLAEGGKEVADSAIALAKRATR